MCNYVISIYKFCKIYIFKWHAHASNVEFNFSFVHNNRKSFVYTHIICCYCRVCVRFVRANNELKCVRCENWWAGTRVFDSDVSSQNKSKKINNENKIRSFTSKIRISWLKKGSNGEHFTIDTSICFHLIVDDGSQLLRTAAQSPRKQRHADMFICTGGKWLASLLLWWWSGALPLRILNLFKRIKSINKHWASFSI